MAFDSYVQALSYLYGFTDYEKQPADLYSADRFDLGRMGRLLGALGNPHRRFSSLHVAGTKGKGSVAAMSERILREAGYRTGLFTSPHLHTFRERMRVDGQLIPQGMVVEGLRRLQPYIPSIPGLTTFELITALGFWYFAQMSVHTAVVEVGLGGRLDATNVITPLVSVITPLSYDHTAILGTTLAAIAREKGGIIKSGVPVVSAPQPEEALPVIEEICRERGAALTLVGRDWQWRLERASSEGQSFSILPGPGPLGAAPRLSERDLGMGVSDSGLVCWIPLLGRHQVVNATTAWAAMQQLQAGGLRIPPDSILRGLRQVEWPGRLEVLGQRPWLVVDGAHNRASAQELRRALEEIFPHERLFLIFATYEDKDISGMLEVLLPVADELTVTRFDSPRAASAVQLAERARDMGAQAARADNVGQALAQARQRAGTQDLICVTGSVRFAGEARMAWAQAERWPLPPSDPPLPPLPEQSGSRQ